MNNHIRGIDGANTILTTYEVNTEVVVPIDSTHTHTPVYYKFQFYNRDTCTVSINGQPPIMLYQGQNFSVERDDMPIESFKIIEPNIRYHWLGYR